MKKKVVCDTWKMMNNYRDKLYAEYSTAFKGADKNINLKEMESYWPIFKYSVRNWLPKSEEVNIVDLGCGNGTIMSFLKNKEGYKNVFGVDISESQIDLAKQHMPTAELGNALEYLQKSSMKFDLILAFDVIEHLNKDEALDLISLCYEKLNHGGRVIFQTPNASSPFFGVVRYGDFTHELGFTPNLLSQLLTLYGFVNIESRETGPLPYGYSLFSSIRYLAWQFLRTLLCLYSIIETGSCDDKIFTRVFIQSAIKK
tara:strand:+ start:35958 stop:36728 length:771 start_codon:yes stop_codon:yes gene_type:complete